MKTRLAMYTVYISLIAYIGSAAAEKMFTAKKAYHAAHIEAMEAAGI